MVNFFLGDGVNVRKHVSWDYIKERVINRSSFYIDIVNPQKEDIESLRSIFHFHSTNLEDCTFFSENPKLEEYRGYIFTVLHSLILNTNIDSYKSFDVHIFLGENYIITVHDTELDVINEAVGRIVNANEVKDVNCEYIYYTILDSIVDSYFPLLNYWSQKIDDIEERIFDTSSNDDPINIIMSIRKELLRLKRIMMPQKEIIYKLTHTNVNFISEATRIYLQDVFDHITHTFNSIEDHRDILSNLMDAHFSKTSAAMNEVMKRLTVISTIFMPLTFIVGIYGMNFRYMPEIEWRYGYYIIMAVMLAAAVAFSIYFKKKKWF